jgi:hypothetical protein
MKVLWDNSTPPAPHHVLCLEIRSGIATVGKSYGIILDRGDDDLLKRVGYFSFQHYKDGTKRQREQEAKTNWLHKGAQRTLRIT